MSDLDGYDDLLPSGSTSASDGYGDLVPSRKESTAGAGRGGQGGPTAEQARLAYEARAQRRREQDAALMGARTDIQYGPRDPMLKPEFVSSVREEFGKLPEEQRLGALQELAQQPTIRGRAAKQILADVTAENDANARFRQQNPTISKIMADASRQPQAQPGSAGSSGRAAPTAMPDVSDFGVMPQDQQVIKDRLATQAGARAGAAAENSVAATMDRADLRSRDLGAEAFAKDHKYLGAVTSGAYRQLRGAANLIPMIGDFAAKLVGFDNGEFQESELSQELKRKADSYMPAVGKQKMDAAWDKGEFGGWLLTNVAAQAPQAAQTMLGAMLPGGAPVALTAMGIGAAGDKYGDTGRSDAAVASGLVEVATEKLPLHMLERTFKALKAVPESMRSTVVGQTARALLETGKRITAQSLTEGVEEVVAQLGNNAIDKYMLGDKTKSLTDGMADAGVLGAAMGGSMVAPHGARHVYDAATNSPQREVARAIDSQVGATSIDPVSIDAGVRSSMDPQRVLNAAMEAPPAAPTILDQMGVTRVDTPTPVAPGGITPVNGQRAIDTGLAKAAVEQAEALQAGATSDIAAKAAIADPSLASANEDFTALAQEVEGASTQGQDPALQRMEGEADKDFAKRVVDKREAPAQLPEDHSLYFEAQEGTKTVPISDLVSTKTQEQNEQAGNNGPKRMAAAAAGELAKRPPITVMPSESSPGKYEVVDGNGTLASVGRYGWKSLPVNVVSRQEGEVIKAEGARQEKVKKAAKAAIDVGVDSAVANEAQQFVLKSKPAAPVQRSEEKLAKLREFIQPVLDKAQESKASFDQSVRDMASSLGAGSKIPGLKAIKRASEKLHDDLSKPDAPANPHEDMLDDLLRASIVVKSDAEIPAALEELNQRFDVLKVKDRFSSPTEEGYRDILARVRLPSGLIAEVQIHTPHTFETKELGHKIFETIRDLPKGHPDRARAADLSRRLYAAPNLPAASQRLVTTGTASEKGTPDLAASASASSVKETSDSKPAGVMVSSGLMSERANDGQRLPDTTSTSSPEGSSTQGRSRTSSSVEPSGADFQSNTSDSFVTGTGNHIVAEPSLSEEQVAHEARVEAWAQQAIARWQVKPRVVIVQGMGDSRLPDSIRQEGQAQKVEADAGSPTGAFYRGTVYLFAPAIKSPAKAVETIFHEGLGHFGLRGFWQDQGLSLREDLLKLATLMPDRVAKKAVEYKLAQPQGSARATLESMTPAARALAAEEVLAELAETRPEHSFIQGVLAKIRGWLRKHMPTLVRSTITDAELIQNYILPARRWVEKGVGRATGKGAYEVPAFKRGAEEIGGYRVKEEGDGSLLVYGDQSEIRSLLPDGVLGSLREGALKFTASQAPRVRAALAGEDVTYGRAGEVRDNPRYKSGERQGKYIGAPAAYDTPAKLPKLRRLLKQLAIEGEPGKMWYEMSGRAVLEMTGHNRDEARKFVSLLAIYSPQAKVDANSTFAIRAWAQYKAGEPISVKTGTQDKQASEVLYDGKQWGGEKTNNFFRNLMREIDQELASGEKQGVTVDMWMMRAAGYETDAPTQAAYRFVENETNRLAKELGWEPQQVQAAIWVAMKARLENKGVKQRTEAKSEKRGYMRYVDKKDPATGKVKQVREVIDEVKHRGVWLDEAMALKVEDEDTQGAKFDFADGLRRHLGQISWEARPGRSTGVLPGVNDAPYQQQAEFQQAVAEALQGPNGEDLLAKHLGLMVDGNIAAPGVWQAEVAAGMQQQVVMAPAKGDAGKTTIDPAQAKLLDAYASTLGLLLRQEGVGWHKPFFASTKASANGVDVRLNRPATPGEVKALWGALDQRLKPLVGDNWNDGVGIVSSASGVRLINFGAIQANPEWHRIAIEAAEETLPDGDAYLFASDGALATNNWKESPDGQDYVARIGASGRPDVLGFARDVLGPRVQAVFEDFSERYDWGDPGELPAFRRDVGSDAERPDAASPDQGRNAGSLTYGKPAPGAAPPVEAVHYSRQPRTSLSSSFYGTGLRGAEAERLRAADPRLRQRIYFYVNVGQGIHPEAGVGGHAHRVTLANLYDADSGKIRGKDTNDFEAKVLDAGYDGYFTRQFNRSGAAVLLGKHNVPVEQMAGQATAAAAPAEQSAGDLTGRIAKSRELPMGALTGPRWKQLLSVMMPEVLQAYPEAKAWAREDGMYKDELARELDEEKPAFARQIVRNGRATPNDAIVPSDPAFDKAWSGDIAVFPGTRNYPSAPIRVLAGRDVDGRGFGLEHLVANGLDSDARKPRRQTGDMAEDFVAQVVRATQGRRLQVYEDGRRLLLVNAAQGQTMVLEPREDWRGQFYSVVTMYPGAKPPRGQAPIWQGALPSASLAEESQPKGARMEELEGPAFQREVEPSPLYVSRPIKNAQALHDWAVEQGIQNVVPPEKMHVTLVYSKTPVHSGEIGLEDAPAELEIPTSGRAIERLGDDQDLVLRFTSPEMSDRWMQTIKAGATWDFGHGLGDYQPHITLSYKDKVTDVTGMQPYSGAITLGPEKAEDLKTGWSSSLEEAPAFALPGGWVEPGESKMDNLIYQLQDRQVDLKRVAQAIRDNGSHLSDRTDGYLREELYHGRVAARTNSFMQREMLPLLTAMRAAGVSMAQLEEYLHARHAQERNAEMQARNPNRVDNDALSGMTNADAAAILANAKPAMQALAARVDAMIDASRDLMELAGLETSDTMRDIRGKYKHYVPLFRDELEPSRSRPSQGQGFSVKGSNLKRALGSNAKVTNILAHIAMEREATIVRAEKNLVAMAVYAMAAQNQNPDFWEVDNPPKVGQLDTRREILDLQTGTMIPNPDYNTVYRTVQPNYKGLDNVLVAKFNGHERVVVFNKRNDRAMRMARALKNLDMDPISKALNIVGRGTRWLAAVNTQYNPVFSIVNFARDIQGAVVNLTDTRIAGKQAQVLRNVLPAMKAIWRVERDGMATGRWEDLWREFQARGGKTGFKESFATAADRAQALAKEMKALDRSRPMKVIHGVLDLLSVANDAIENAVRLSAYQTGRLEGLSMDRAASLGKNLTVNFNRKGNVGSHVGSLYAFFNAALQGTARTAQALAGPAGKKIVAGGLMVGVIQALLLAMMDDEDKDNIPDYVLDKNLVIPVGPGRFVQIPMPQGLNVLPNISRSIINAGVNISQGQRVEYFKAVTQLLSSVAGAVSPISGGSLIEMLTPTVVDPIAQLSTNTDFMGKKIYRERNDYDGARPGFDLAKDGTNPAWKGAAYVINLMTGGDEYARNTALGGYASPQPEALRFVAESLGGGVWRETERLIDALITAGSPDKEVQLDRLPFVSRFYGDLTDDQAPLGKFYENMATISALRREINGLEADGSEGAERRLEKLRDRYPEADLIGEAEGTLQAIKELRNEKRELLVLSGTEARVKEVEHEQALLMREFNKQVREALAKKR